MPDKLLAEENIPAAAIKLLRAIGWDVLSIRETAPGIADSEVVRLVDDPKFGRTSSNGL